MSLRRGPVRLGGRSARRHPGRYREETRRQGLDGIEFEGLGQHRQARKARREMTYPEVLLWQRLRRKAAGVRFRKQHAIGPYLVDFYCPARVRLHLRVIGVGQDAGGGIEAG